MHEMSLAQSLLDLAVQHAGGHPITKLRVRVGPLSGVVADSLDFCFGFVSKGTLGEGASLEYERASVLLQCKACGAEVPTDDWAELPGHEVVYLATERGCASCGSKDLRVSGGFDFQLLEIEVRDPSHEGTHV